MMRLDIVSDAICPWCYVGKRHMERALAILVPEGIRFNVHWNPFQLNPDMPMEGVERRAYRIQKFGSWEKSQQLDARITQAAAGAGLEFHMDRLTRTPNTLKAHRLIALAGQQGVQDAILEAIFQSYFLNGGDIGADDILLGCAELGGMERAAIAAFLATDELLAQIQAQEHAARSTGVSGVPSFFLEGHSLFSGAQPVEQMAKAFRHAHKVLSERPAQAAE
ncbi:MAG: DsbA family oxidoreductase [Acetobacteraceae bacterium]|nr:DsbA family oxidoreductase [Acetobacteraceae bacterium]MSP30520.1 DsbA family oxidoreductase [Acetobacteraceae bacterium]